jgi:hypothetical protein
MIVGAFTDPCQRAGKGEHLVLGIKSKSRGPLGRLRWAVAATAANLPCLAQTKPEPYLEDTAPSSWKTARARLAIP